MKVVNKFLFFVHIMKIAEKEKPANLFLSVFIAYMFYLAQAGRHR
jgi:hypothetical protein